MFAAKQLVLKRWELRGALVCRHPQRRLCCLFVQAGGATFRRGQVTQRLKPGEALVFSTSAGGVLSPVPGGRVQLASFHLGYEPIVSLFGSEEICFCNALLNRFAQHRHFPAHHVVAANCHRVLKSIGPADTIVSRSALLHILAHIVSEEAKRLKAELAPMPAFLNLLTRLSLEELQTLSVEALARRFGFSRRHMLRMFRKHLGTSIADLKREVRLLRAMIMLHNPNSRIGDIAAATGFQNLGLFSLQFRRRFGVSPSQWRRSPGPTTGQNGDCGLEDLAHEQCRLRGSGLCFWYNIVSQNGAAAKGKLPRQAGLQGEPAPQKPLSAVRDGSPARSGARPPLRDTCPN